MRELMYQLERMYALLEMRSDQEGKIMKDLLEEISDHHGFDMGCFLVDLPFDLERDGFEDEAISVARKFAFVDEANMRGRPGSDFGLQRAVRGDPCTGETEPEGFIR